MRPLDLFRFCIIILIVYSFLQCSSSEQDPIPPVNLEIGAPSDLEVFDIGNQGDGSDIRVFFEAGSNNSQVQEYRVIVTKEDAAGALDLATAQQLSSDFYYSFSNSSSTPKLNLVNNFKDTDGDQIQNEVEYNLFILAIPKSAEADAQISQPSAVFKLTDRELRDLYISSNATNSVELFDGVTGEHIKSFVPAGSGGLGSTQEVIFLDDGSLLVTGLANTALKRYNGTTGAYLGDFTSGYNLDLPTKTSIGLDGYIYVSQWGNTQNAIVRFDLQTGEFVDEVVGSFFQGMDHTWDQSGNFYTVSFGLKELRKYDSQFNLIFTTTIPLTGPVNVWIDPSGEIFVVDWQDGTVKKFDDQGIFINTFISGLTNVEGYLFDGDDLYLCDWRENQVNIYNAITGSFKATFIDSDAIGEPNGITFGPDQRPN